METGKSGIAFVCMTKHWVAVWNSNRALPHNVKAVKKGTLYVHNASDYQAGVYSCEGQTREGISFMSTAKLIIKSN